MNNQVLIILIHVPWIFCYCVLWPTNAQLFHKLSYSYMFHCFRVIESLKYLCNLARYWLQAPWGWHDSVETCSSVIICEIIVHLLVIVQNNQVLSGNYVTVKQRTLRTAQWGFQSPLDERATGTGLRPQHSADLNKCFISGATYGRSLNKQLALSDGFTQQNS